MYTITKRILSVSLLLVFTLSIAACNTVDFYIIADKIKAEQESMLKTKAKELGIDINELQEKYEAIGGFPSDDIFNWFSDYMYESEDNDPQLNELLSYYHDDVWFYLVVEDGGKGMTVKTENIDNIENVNEQLGLPGALSSMMGMTSMSDGLQSAEHDGIAITWEYREDEYGTIKLIAIYEYL